MFDQNQPPSSWNLRWKEQTSTYLQAPMLHGYQIIIPNLSKISTFIYMSYRTRMRLKDQVIIICKGYLVFTCLGKDIYQITCWWKGKLHIVSYFLRGPLHLQILFENKRAVGVEYVKNGRLETVLARKEIVLSAGAIGSPQILMLSGIGHKDHLSKFGVWNFLNVINKCNVCKCS